MNDTADGIFGSKTLAAVLEFQSRNSLTVDGKAGSKTLTLLYLFYGIGNSTGGSVDYTSGNIFDGDYTTLKHGSSGERGLLLQTVLKLLNYADVPINRSAKEKDGAPAKQMTQLGIEKTHPEADQR